MRSRILVLVMLLVFVLAVGAQAGGGIMAKGVRAGVNIAGHSGDDTDDNHESRTAFVGGVFVMYALSPALFLQPELLYSQKGYKWEDEGWEETGKFTYLEIPVVLRYMVPMEGAVAPNLFAGIAPAFLLSAEVEAEYDEGMHGLLSATETTDVKDHTKSIDFGIVVGGGVNYDMGSGLLMFDARYTMGMTSIDDSDHDWDVKNKAITLMVGYGIK